MTDSNARVTPTPGDLAAARRPAMPGHPASPPSFDRHRWEQALLAAELPHHAARLLGWGLPHVAGNAGYLPAGTANAERLARTLRLTGRQVRLSLQQLEEVGLISRPDIHTWQPKDLVRPITLTLPTTRARGEEPPSTRRCR
jgi:hypothetical protein